MGAPPAVESNSSSDPGPGRGKRWVWELAAVLGMAVLAVFTWHWVSPRSSPINYLLTGDVLPAVPHPQRPQTLDPALFTGRVSEGYRVARERPALLERLPCYCGCYLTHGHQNNLDCFRDRHSETCEMCLTIALRAEQLEKSGYGHEDIKRIIDRDFAPHGNAGR